MGVGEMGAPPMMFPGQPEAGVGESSQADDTEPMTEQHMAFLQQVRLYCLDLCYI